jgi:hypothetical protein
MSIMARELCGALDIDISSLYDSLYDEVSGHTLAHDTSAIMSEVNRSDDSSQVSMEEALSSP